MLKKEKNVRKLQIFASITSLLLLLQLDFRETSLEFYKMMLNCAQSSTDIVKALISVAETAKELGLYEEAYNCFKKIDALESSMRLSDRKVSF